MGILSRRVAPIRPPTGELAPGLDTTEGRPSQAKMISGVQSETWQCPPPGGGGRMHLCGVVPGILPCVAHCFDDGTPRRTVISPRIEAQLLVLRRFADGFHKTQIQCPAPLA